MALEIRRGKSKWWYARVRMNGRTLCRNLGVVIRGVVPGSLREVGDRAFERSRARAQAALERLQLELKKRGAAEELVQTLHELRTGARISSIPLTEMPARWKERPRRRPSNPRYLAQAERTLDRLLQFLRVHHPSVREMAQVRPPMARAFMAAELERGIAAKTYNNVLIFLRSCFETLRTEAGLAANPFAGIPPQTEDPVYRRPFSAEELAVILAVARRDAFSFPIFATAVSTALRLGDCCLLLKSAIDLPNGFLRVKTSKTGEWAQIPIFPLLREALAAAPAVPDSPYVFPVQAEKYLKNPSYLSERTRRVLSQAGFHDPAAGDPEPGDGPPRDPWSEARSRGLRRASVRDFHSLRVTWVTLALLAGVPLEVVQKVTGHHTAQIVLKHYFQPAREDLRRVLAEKLPPLLGGETAPVRTDRLPCA